MYSASSSFNKKINIDNVLNPTCKLVVTTSVSDVDVSRFVEKFGTISRVMEYDTGKFSPGSHSFTMTNTNEAGDYLFTLRNKINSISLPGTAYWTDRNYKVSFGFKDAANLQITGLQDDLIEVYQGTITSKSEDRIEETVDVSSNDILRDLVDTRLAVKNLTKDDLFDYTDNTLTNTEQVQPEIRYGKHYLNTAAEQSITVKGVTIAYTSSAKVTFVDPHLLKQWDKITISNATVTAWNGDYVVSAVDSSTVVTLWSANLGVSSSADCTRYIWHQDLVSEDMPSTCLMGISNPYVGNYQSGSVGEKATIYAALQRSGYPNTLHIFTDEIIDIPHDGSITPYFIKNSKDNYNKYQSNVAFIAQIDSFAPLPESKGGSITYIEHQPAGYIRITTATAHGMPDGTSVTIVGTTNYNGTYTISSASGTQFKVVKAYVADEFSGTVIGPSYTHTYITFSDSPMAVANGVTSIGSYSAGTMLVTTTYPHGLVNGDRVALEVSPAGYDGDYVVSGITGATPNSFRITHTDNGTATGSLYLSPFPITIYNNSASVHYEGNHTLYVLTATTAYIDTPYIDNQTSPRNYFMCRNSVTLTATPAAGLYPTTGDLYVSTKDIGGVWYFPLYNRLTPSTDYDTLSFSGATFYYWDYVAKMWCLLPAEETSPSVVYGYTFIDSPNDNGIYIYFRNDGAITPTGQEEKWSTWPSQTSTWWHYMQGTGPYWSLGDKKPQVCMSFQNQQLIDSTGAPSYTVAQCYANPVAILYDILINQVGMSEAYLDKGDFKSLDPTTYTWDAAANYFLNSGDWETGGNIAIKYTNETTALDLVQEVLTVSGLMLINSHIRSDDRRLRLILNTDYTHGTSTIAATFSTNNCVTGLSITSDNDKIRDQILITDYAPTPTNLKYNLITKGTGTRTFSIAQEEEPSMYWYNSFFWADRCAQNYLNKLEDAWEDVEIKLDARAICIELGDYVQVYDHKVAESIVLQAYSWSFNLDTSRGTIVGKKVWSSKD